MRLAVDLSAVLWNTLLTEAAPDAVETVFNEKTYKVNSVATGYERCVNSIIAYMQEAQAQPIDMILVPEGTNSKAPRLMIYSDYKSGKDKAPLYYDHFDQIKTKIIATFRGLGSTVLFQNNTEADDTLAWLAENTRQPLLICTVDNDLVVLNKTNKHGARVIVSVSHTHEHNKYGVFPIKYVTVYKAMVGDSGDKIGGIKGFGKEAWIDFHREFGEAGMAEMARLGDLGTLEELAPESVRNKMVQRIYAGKEEFLRSYKLAKLHPEWVNTPGDPIQWLPGFVRPLESKDERLAKYQAQIRLVTSDNYAQALAFLKAQVPLTPFSSLDLETSTPPESDDWLAARDAESKVDVIASVITGGSISFGANGQYAYYISVNHKDTNNVTIEQFKEMVTMLDPQKVTVAHNAQGFELAVMYLNMGHMMKDNGWRGFYPNMHDTRISASWVNENRLSQGLKNLSKDYFGYEQTSYDQVLASVPGAKKMDDLPAINVLHYGCDDVYTAAGLWVFHSLFMEFEGTLQDFMRVEQKPMYLQALGYVNGIPMDMRKLMELKAKDMDLRATLEVVLNSYLIAKGWEGTIPPTINAENVTPALVKHVYEVILGSELKTMVRTITKFPILIKEAANSPDGDMLAAFLATEDWLGINKLIQDRFSGKPEFNIGSNKQLQTLLYDAMGLPVRLRNRPTDKMKAEGLKEGQARADEDAMKMAINLDVTDNITKAVLEAVIELKSINTRNSLYWDAYPGMVHWQTGMVHPQLKQSWTNTRRYSASDPNVQQQEGSYNGVRSVVLPHHRDAIIASLDESAQELRQLADYCKDETLLSCYIGTKEQIKDVHSIVGAKIAGITYEAFRARYKLEESEARLPDAEKTVAKLFLDIRQRAKITIFSLIYGAMAPKIAETLGITVEDAQSYIDTIFLMFPGIKIWRDLTEEYARTHGYVPIYGGGVRHLADLMNSMDRWIASKAMRQAGNSRIQGSGANQIKRIMTRIWDSRLIEDFDYRFYMTVHDESVHSMHKDHAADVLKILHGFMTEQYLEVVPSASSIGIGKSFGTLRELGEVYDADKIKEAVNDMFMEKVA